MQRFDIMPWCNPPSICLFCIRNPRISSGIGYCEQCRDAGIPGNPGSHYPKCEYCNRYHAPHVLEFLLTIGDDTSEDDTSAAKRTRSS